MIVWRFANIFFIVLLFYNSFHTNYFSITAEKIRYFSTEHPRVTFTNPQYVEFCNLTSQRYGRRNPFYYVGLHYKSLTSVNYNVNVDFYFYEYLTNVYKRGFIEMHFDACHMVHNDKFFGAPLKQGKLAKPCPWPAGEYNMYNMTIDSRLIPKSFPFRKGRIYANASSTTYKQSLMEGYIDFELKETKIKRI